MLNEILQWATIVIYIVVAIYRNRNLAKVVIITVENVSNIIMTLKALTTSETTND